MKKGIKLYKTGQFQEAVRFFRGLDVDGEGRAEVSYFLGLCYTQLEQFDEALIYLDQVVASGHDFAQIYQARMVIGFVYATTGRYRLAEFEFQYLLDQGYESSKVHAALGYVLYKQDNIAASVKNLEEALVMDAGNYTALNSLAFIMADQNIRLELAKNYIQRALKIRPDHPPYLDTYGWILFKTGDIQQAHNVLQKAVRLAPAEMEIAEHLNQVRKTGRISN